MNAENQLDYSDRLICCEERENAGYSGDDCFEKWEREQRIISNELTKAKATYAREKARLDNASSWEQKLKTYWDAIRKTDGLITAVSQELTQFTDFSNKVCTNTGLMIEATRILTCSVWKAYQCTHELKTKVTSIINDIKCQGKIPLTAPVVKSLTDLEKKAEEAQNALAKAITEILKVLYIAISLNDSICNECPDDCQDDLNCCQQGLKANLKKLNELICNGPAADSDADLGPCEPRNNCSDLVPLSANKYYQDTQSEYNNARGETNAARNDLNDARKRQDDLAAAQKGLDNAIKAANDARKS